VNILDDFRSFTGMTGKFSNISRRMVTKYVRIYCAESFQTISEAMRHCWAFAIALDSSNKSSVTYLDYGLRFVLSYRSFNVHMIACTMYESHTGENIFKLTSKSLSILCSNWTEKLIDITTDGASNMTGCHVGERVANAGFFRIWCAAHQLALVLQARFKSMFNKRLVHVIQGTTGHL
jgi:hypothetical protein